MGRADKTLEGIRYWLDGDALPAIGNLPLDRISRTQCRELQERVEARGAINLPLEQFREAMAKVKGREAIGRVLLALWMKEQGDIEELPEAGGLAME